MDSKPRRSRQPWLLASALVLPSPIVGGDGCRILRATLDHDLSAMHPDGTGQRRPSWDVRLDGSFDLSPHRDGIVFVSTRPRTVGQNSTPSGYSPAR
jgi:hypothetical protein